MIITNVVSFPIPPSEEFIDFGPFIGLWYLGITIKIAFSKKWIHQQIIGATI
jgi:hypothetical protein